MDARRMDLELEITREIENIWKEELEKHAAILEREKKKLMELQDSVLDARRSHCNQVLAFRESSRVRELRHAEQQTDTLPPDAADIDFYISEEAVQELGSAVVELERRIALFDLQEQLRREPQEDEDFVQVRRKADNLQKECEAMDKEISQLRRLVAVRELAPQHPPPASQVTPDLATEDVAGIVSAFAFDDTEDWLSEKDVQTQLDPVPSNEWPNEDDSLGTPPVPRRSNTKQHDVPRRRPLEQGGGTRATQPLRSKLVHEVQQAIRHGVNPRVQQTAQLNVQPSVQQEARANLLHKGQHSLQRRVPQREEYNVALNADQSAQHAVQRGFVLRRPIVCKIPNPP